MQLKFYSLESWPAVFLTLALLSYSLRCCYSDTCVHDRTPHLLTHIAIIDMTKSPSSEEQDIQIMLSTWIHLKTRNCNFQIEGYVFKHYYNGIYIINLGKV